MSDFIVKCNECNEVWIGDNVDSVQVPAFKHFHESSHERFTGADPNGTKVLEVRYTEIGYRWFMVDNSMDYDLVAK